MKSFGDFFWDSVDRQQAKNTKDENMEIGKVINESPLIVKVDGLDLYIKDLYINPHLLEWDEPVHAYTTIAGSPPHRHEVLKIHHYNKLKVGVYVQLYGVEWNDKSKTYQRYILSNLLVDGRTL